jgi:hypothetical protein
MKKIQILGIAIVCSTFLMTACSKKVADATTATKSVATMPQEEAPPTPEIPLVQGRQAAEPVEESLTKNTKGIGVNAQAVDQALPVDVMDVVAPVPEIQMPPLSKEEEAALRKRIMEAQEKQKKKKG